jgi:hypothetical protein
MALEKISDKQKEILEFIKSEILNRGYPPSVRYLRRCTFKVHIQRPCSSRDTGAKGLHKKRSCQKQGYRNYR